MWNSVSNILRPILALVSFISLGYAGTGGFNGGAALENTKRTVAFGERPSGSPSIERLRSFILAGLKPLAGQTILDTFKGQTPTGPIPMVNVIERFQGTSGKAIVVTGHYDTKRIPMMTFRGANDGGSSTGFLLEFARAIAATKHKDDIYVVFFDGEEAVGEWSESDSKYGSRHLADKWLTEGMLPKIKALINVDMIGDKNLNVNNDGNSSESLRVQVRKIAAGLNYGQYFRQDRGGGIDDDHMPFIAAGVNAIDLIDFDYGPGNAYWHQATDTFDKLGAHSFQVIGDVVVALVKQLDWGCQTRRMLMRREVLEGLMVMMAGDSPFGGGGSKGPWKDATFTLEHGKTTHESFGDVTVYFEGKTQELGSMVAGSVLLHPGQEPHPPHQHPEEEFMLVSEGSGQILAGGKTTNIGPGGLMFSESNSLHGIKNTGSVPMRFYYFKWQK